MSIGDCIPEFQNAVLRVCSGRIHQLLVTTAKAEPAILSRTRKNQTVTIPEKEKYDAVFSMH